jgi:hypothetical protein
MAPMEPIFNGEVGSVQLQEAFARLFSQIDRGILPQKAQAVEISCCAH